MAESIEEFYTYDTLTDTNLRESAELIHAFLKGDANLSNTAQSLTAIFDAPDAAPTAADVLEQWIVCATEQLSETHNALVELTVELRTRQQQKGEDCLSKFDNSLIMSFGDRWLRYGDPDPEESMKEEARLDWTNLNRFVALLYSAGIQRLAIFGERTLTMTLQRGGWRVNWKGSENTSDSVIALEGHAPAAVHWIIISGRRLYYDSITIRTNWPAWVADMAWIVDKDDLNKDIRSLCQEAKSLMDSIGA